MPRYRLRVDDVLELVYRQTRTQSSAPYRLEVGDRIRLEMQDEPDVLRELIVQPDGTISVPLLGQVQAAGRRVEELRLSLQKDFTEYYVNPLLTLTPLEVNTRLRDLLDTVDRRFGAGGLTQQVRVTPDGTIALVAVGSVPVQGLSLEELKWELNERYTFVVQGLEVQPILLQRAPRFVYVLGEVRTPGRYELQGPTSVMQAISLAGGVSGSATANLRQVVLFRRDGAWGLHAAMIDLHDAVLRGGSQKPVRELWLADSDVIVVPKTKILIFDEFIEAIFVRGLYGVFPTGVNIGFNKASTL